MARYLHGCRGTIRKDGMTHRRPGSRARVTIDDLARRCDRATAAAPARSVARPPSAPPVRRSPALTAAQSDVRLARLKARAAGIRFALQYENQTAAQAKVLRQILQNLELAIRGMEMTVSGA